MKASSLFASVLLPMVVVAPAAAADKSTEIVLVRDGKAQMPIVAGSVAELAAELQRYLKDISGAEFETAAADTAGPGIFVGLAGDFPRHRFHDAKSLGPEGFILRSDGDRLFLIGDKPLGVQHAVATLLHELGCRWFFPGDAWTVIPKQRTIAGRWDMRQKPSFPVQRSIWAGFGLYRKSREDWRQWDRHNRMGGPAPIRIHHSWIGLNVDRDFEKHPERFALVDGRRQPTKPCYSNPEVIGGAIEWSLQQADGGAKMITLSAPDGLGFCECPKCLASLGAKESWKEHGTTWARRADGTLVNATSETLFALVNAVAAAVAKKHPHVILGCYAYSAYSHPPSFSMHPNAYIQTTTAFRRTPLTLDQQLAAFGKKTRSLGIREYYSVYQWDWDEPYPGRVRPDRLRKDLRRFHQTGVTAINAEASNNWAARGLGYYVAAQLLWDVDADVSGLIGDFYRTAFGPAAGPMERYYTRWYGPVAAVTSDAPPPVAQTETDTDRKSASIADLKAAFGDLDEAARLARGNAPCRQRVDQLRMYLHYLLLRARLAEAAKTNDRENILAAIEAETVFGGRLTDTNMLHARPLIGKAFLRRFRKFKPLLAGLPEENAEGKQWRKIGTPPSHEELEQLWAEDRQWLEKH